MGAPISHVFLEPGGTAFVDTTAEPLINVPAPDAAEMALARSRFARQERDARKRLMQGWQDAGGVTSRVGLPLDTQFPVTVHNQRYSMDFRGGRLSLSGDNAVVEENVLTVEVIFEGFGLEIRQEGGDEIFGSVHSTIAGDFVNDFVIPEVTLGPGNNRVSQNSIVIYRGPPTNLHVLLSLTEHDSGDRAKVREEVRQKVREIAASGRDALAGGAAGTGAVQQAASALRAESATQTSLQNWIINGAADLINDILGMGDDPYNPMALYLSANEMRSPPDLQTYQCQRDPRTLQFTHYRQLRGRDDGGDEGQIGVCFIVRQVD